MDDKDKYFSANKSFRPQQTVNNKGKSVSAGDDLISLSKTMYIAFLVLGLVFAIILIVNNADIGFVLIGFLFWYLVLEVVKGVLRNIGQISNDIHRMAESHEKQNNGQDQL